MGEPSWEELGKQGQAVGPPWSPPNPDDTSGLGAAGFVPAGGTPPPAPGAAPGNNITLPPVQIAGTPRGEGPLTSQQALPKLQDISDQQKDIYSGMSDTVGLNRAAYKKGVDDTTIIKNDRDAEQNQLEQDIGVRHAQYEMEHKQANDRRAAMNAAQRAKQVDPNKWYKDRGTAGTIGAALAIAGGAFAAGMPHAGNRNNTALDIINRSIDADVNAQKDDIEKGWKELDYQGNEDEKKFVKDNRELAMMRDAKKTAYDHANAQIEERKLQTTDAVALNNLNDVQGKLKLEQTKLDKDDVEHRAVIGDKLDAQKKAAAAAAAARQLHEEEKIKEGVEKRLASSGWKRSEKAVKEGRTDVEAAWLDSHAARTGDLKNAGYGHTLDSEELIAAKAEAKAEGKVAKSTEAEKDKKVDDAVKGYGVFADKAIGGATPWNAALSYLPKWMAPNANMAADSVNTYNNTVLPQVLKGLESRMTPEMVDEQKHALTISPGMSDDQKQARKQALMDLARTGSAFKTGKGTPVEDDMAGISGRK